MNARQASRLAWPLWLVLAIAWPLSRIALPLTPQQWQLDPPFWHLGFLAYGAIGALIVSRKPGNRVGWLFLVVGTFDILSAIIRAVAMFDGTGKVPVAVVHLAAWAQAWLWAPSMGGLVLLVWVFPHGHLPRGAWRWGVWATLAAVAVLLVPTPLVLWPLRGPVLLTDAALPGLAGILPAAAFGVLAFSLAAAVVSLAVRLRSARGDERQQLKWFVYAGLVMVAVMLTDILVLDALDVPDSVAREAVNTLSFLLVPVGAAVAILRYRLYDIDRVINRTVVYSALTLVLGAAYLAAVTAMRAVTAGFTGDTALAVAASTLAVAALFRPALQRIQGAVDRRFNRARYDAAATVHDFSARLRDEVDLETLSTDLLGVVRATMQPATTTLWLREAAP